MAKALVSIRMSRTGESQNYHAQVVGALDHLMADSLNGHDLDWEDEQLSLARNLPAWIIAADYLFAAVGPNRRDDFRDLIRSLTSNALSDDETGDRDGRSLKADVRYRANNRSAWSIAALACAGSYIGEGYDGGRLALAAKCYKGYVGDLTGSSAVYVYRDSAGGQNGLTYTAWDSLYSGMANNFAPIAIRNTATFHYDGCTDELYTRDVKGMMTQDMNEDGEKPTQQTNCYYDAGNKAPTYIKSAMGAVAIAAFVLGKTPGHSYLVIFQHGYGGSSGEGLLAAAEFWTEEEAAENLGSTHLWEFAAHEKSSWVPFLVNGLTNVNEITEPSQEGKAGLRYLAGTKWLKSYF